jgi:UDP-N-acetylglucosamine--N-acetylmuramyl-(pentapeptide) pyrophosphoryl-undecaprenol N-acetylglucosamine transferase
VSSFLISCGGTGGHLSPGIALAEGLGARGHEAVLLISQKKVDSRLVEKYPNLRFVRMPGVGFSWTPLGLYRFAASQARAFRFCLKLIRERRPDVIVGFGGFTSAPASLAGYLLDIPVALHEANRVPGRAVRVFGRIARRVYLPVGIRIGGVRSNAIRFAGLPVRSEMRRTPAAAAREVFGLDPKKKVLVVLGGSQGASCLNTWALEKMELLASKDIQLVCVTGPGKSESTSVQMRAGPDGPVKTVFMPFCDRMSDLLSAADLVVSRAGAGTIAELMRCEVPAVLIPYPFAASDHQRANAAFFERQCGGIVVEETMLGSLHQEVLDLVFNEWLLKQFRGNLRRMDRTSALDLMVSDLEAIAAGPVQPAPYRQIGVSA